MNATALSDPSAPIIYIAVAPTNSQIVYISVAPEPMVSQEADCSRQQMVAHLLLRSQAHYLIDIIPVSLLTQQIQID
jgi:hypothetical protein